MVFSEAKNTSGREFKEAMEIYAAAFPAHERHTIEVIGERVNKGRSRLYVGKSKEEIVFVALLWPLANTDFILLDYMATHEKHRGKKIASLFLEYMSGRLQKEGKHFVFEVEDPEYGDNKSEREKRIAFYRKNSAKLLKGVRYELQPLQGVETTDMLLMIFPGYPSGTISAAVVRQLVIQIYRELYNRDAADLLRRYFHFDDNAEIELV